MPEVVLLEEPWLMYCKHTNLLYNWVTYLHANHTTKTYIWDHSRNIHVYWGQARFWFSYQWCQPSG